MPLNLDPTQQVPPDPKKIIGTGAIQTAQRLQRFFQISLKQAELRKFNNIASPDAGIASEPDAAIFVKAEQDSLGKIKRRRVLSRWNMNQGLAFAKLFICQTAIFRTEDKSAFLSRSRSCRQIFRDNFRRLYAAPPGAKSGRCGGRVMERRKGRFQIRKDRDIFKQGQPFGSGQRLGLEEVPALRLNQNQFAATHIGAGSRGHADVFGKTRF